MAPKIIDQQGPAVSGDIAAGVPRGFWKGARPSWHQRRRHRAVLRAVRSVQGKALDYGCGYGDLTHAISQTHGVQGVDVDPERVSFAAEQYAPVAFTVCDPVRLDFPAGSFDIVVSTVVIHFTGDPREYLGEVHRVLRPGGHLVITCQNSPVVWNLIRRRLGKPPAPSPVWIPTRESFHELLEKEGFQIEAESHFYDPPTDGSWSLRGFPLTLLQQFLSVLSLRATCGYYTIVAKRC